MAAKIIPLPERFLSHTRRLPNGCLEWTGYVDKAGYAGIHVNGKSRQVHHVAWFLHYGWWPAKGFELDHTCHDPNTCKGAVCCPHRRCCEWSHLKLCTHKEHAGADRSNVGEVAAARQRAKTHCPQGHEYNEENTLWYRGNRYCRKCHLTRNREKRAEIREARNDIDRRSRAALNNL